MHSTFELLRRRPEFLFQKFVDHVRLRLVALARFIAAGSATFYVPGPAAMSAMTFLFCLVTADLCWLGFSLTDLSTLLFLVGASVCGVIYAWLRDLDARITSALSALTALLVTVLLSTILQCTLTAHGAKETFDHTLLATDRVLGLDPISFTAFVDLSPLACRVLNVAYMSMGGRCSRCSPFTFGVTITKGSTPSS